ncbi:MAG: hypothetical protein DRJ98_06565 [Thermoprotei archaeon]|nr:MAG: hypothetical protein DRJ98_06565 [Thermoprotei archaeon]RLF17952.1 MAG: hypothetical protein DRN06_02730 [Thermoprotei archaeon]
MRFYDLFECVPVKYQKEKPNSEFFRGILSGGLSVIFDKVLLAVETKCIAKGDPYCEFVVKPAEKQGV